MSEKRIIVPQGMLKAVDKRCVCVGLHLNSEDINNLLKAALQWLSENPIEPTEFESIGLGGSNMEDAELCRMGAIEWQRRMFYRLGGCTHLRVREYPAFANAIEVARKKPAIPLTICLDCGEMLSVL